MFKVLLASFMVFMGASFACAQNIYTIAGNGTGSYSGDGGPATAAELWRPNGMVFDTVGNMYVADAQDGHIRKINKAGVITSVAGGGTGGLGDGGPATAAALNNPVGVAIDKQGNLYIADNANNRIRIVNSSGTINTFAGNGTAGFSGDGGPATAAEINNATDVAVDDSGNVYIADHDNNRVRKVNSAGIISTVAGDGPNNINVGAGYSGDGGPATAAGLWGPAGVFVDASFNIYIADEENRRIRKVNTQGIITTVAGGATLGLGDGGPATAAQLYDPLFVYFDHWGNMLIDDVGNNRIRKVNAAGTISTIAGDSSKGFMGDNGPATAAELNQPDHAIEDAFGNIYISDAGNYRVRKIGRIFNCKGVDTIKVSKTTICTGESITLKGAHGAGYVWSTGTTADSIIVAPASTTTYKLFVTNDTCHSDTSVTINVTPAPVPNVVYNANICLGNADTLKASGGSGYSWNNGTINSTIVVEPASDVVYVVAVSNAVCSVSDSIKVTVHDYPIAAVSNKQFVCAGQAGTISAMGGTAYSWSTGESASSISVSPLVSSVYTVNVSNGFCSVTDSAQVVVNALPVINTCCSRDILKGQSIQLTASGGSVYAWTPSAGLSCADCANPTAGPTETTTYTVTVTSDSGCVASTTIAIDVSCGPVFVPEAFSPNGDGENDNLYVRGECISGLEFEIFDRWGNKLFETNNKDIPWNGVSKGNAMPTGTYIYYLTATLYDGTTIEKKGNVTLVR